MKITAAKPIVMGTSWRNLIFIKVETDEGLYGIGEATVQNREEGVLGYLDGAVRRHVLGSDPYNIEDLWLRMYRNDFWRNGVICTTVMSAIEIACWDIIGKAAGQPVYKLLGGRAHESLKAYANGWYTVDRDPASFSERVKEVTGKGYKALKVDPFGPGTYEMSRGEIIKSLDLVAAIRDAVGPDVEIFIEGHGRFAPRTAIQIGKQLEEFDPGWYEEPVPPENVLALKQVHEQVNIPIATGERLFTRYDYPEFLHSGAVDIVQADIIHAGGMLEMKKIAAMADAQYRVIAPHNSNGPVCTAASVHFGFCTTNFKVQEIFDDFVEPWVKEAVPGVPNVVDGYVQPPTGPGLGIDLNEELIAEHPYKEGFFNLFADDWQKRQFADE